MALATATISYNLADAVGTALDPRRTRVWVSTNVPGEAVIDTAGDKIRLGCGNGTIAADGTGSVTVWVPGTGSNPDTWQTSIHVDYADRHGRASRTFGPFTITTSANLADLVAEMPVQPEYSSTFLDLVQGYLDHGDVDGTLTIDPAIGHHDFDATDDLLVTLGDAPDGRIVSLCAVTGASYVTIDNVTDDVELADDAVATFMHRRGAWRLAGAGSSGPTDVTPPSDITDLALVGGEGEATLTGTNPTDSESTARIKYRVWLTSGGPSGAYLTATSFPIVVTGLAAGAYTAQAYSFSNGGQQTTPDSATGTVTAPITPLDDEMLADSPVYLFMFDDMAPGTTEPPNLGSGTINTSDSTVVGVTFGATWADGGTCAEFDGSDYIRTGIPRDDAAGKSAYTIEWIVDMAAPSGGSNQPIYEGGDYSGAYVVSTGAVIAYTGATPSGSHTFGAPVHMAAVVTGGRTKLYRNGVEVADISGWAPLNGPDASPMIGAPAGADSLGATPGAGAKFVGKMKAFAIYHTAVPEARLLAHAVSAGTA